jgi:hypothetical protein
MKTMVVITADRIDTMNGQSFRTVHRFEHIPVEIPPEVAGWSGRGAGLSPEDVKRIFGYLDDTAANIQSFTAALMYEFSDSHGMRERGEG